MAIVQRLVHMNWMCEKLWQMLCLVNLSKAMWNLKLGRTCYDIEEEYLAFTEVRINEDI